MIVVEGPDGAGKTRLVARLEEKYGLSREPRAVSKEANSLRALGPYVEEELAKGFGMRLYDRFALISTPMYIPLHKTYHPEFDDRVWLEHQHLKFRMIDPVVIFCLPPFEVVEENVMRDDDNKVVQGCIQDIYRNYLCYISRRVYAGQMVWDYTKPNIDQVDGLMRWAQAKLRKTPTKKGK